MSAAVLIVGLIAWGVALYVIFAPMDSGEASDRLRHPGYVPDEVARSFREPFDRELPESGLSTAELERWPVMEREPRT